MSYGLYGLSDCKTNTQRLGLTTLSLSLLGWRVGLTLDLFPLGTTVYLGDVKRQRQRSLQWRLAA